MTEPAASPLPAFFEVQIAVRATEEGGRMSPIFNDYRPSWNLGNRWEGKPILNDGRVLLASPIAPGAVGYAWLQPLDPISWVAIEPGATLPMQEGGRIVGEGRVLAVVFKIEHMKPAIARFVVAVREVLAFVRTAHELGPSARLSAAKRAVCAAYLAGQLLEAVDPDEETEVDDRIDVPGTWPGFGQVDSYWETLDPYGDVDAPVGLASLDDDLLDIYRDLSRGLRAWEAGASSNALWEWKHGLDGHWGDHAARAIRAMQWAGRCVDLEPEPDPASG
jgi:hypothetical protein